MNTSRNLNGGDALRGQTVFKTAGCAACHSIGEGPATGIGPDIRDVRNKPPAALVSDILNPNRAVEERWTAFTVKTRSGEELAGLVTSDIELTLPGGIRKQIPRATSNPSLPPVFADAGGARGRNLTPRNV